jgi:small-conductance mechanosensitive channel
MECGNSNSRVAKIPQPEVLFLNFGDSSLNFELRVWIWDASYRFSVINELNQEIDRSFREAGIEIAFPQMDLYLRSVDKSVVLQISEVPTEKSSSDI